MIIAILACHDRRAMTERALTSLAASAAHAGVDLRAVLFDDGSTDGTAEAARATLPAGSLEVLQGTGDAFWAKGMSIAEQHALSAASDADLLLWLNDDVELHLDALPSLLRVLDGRTDRLAVGATTDPISGDLNYGGYRHVGPHPLRFRHVELQDRAVQVDTLNGNCVLVPVPAARRVGGIEGTYSHALADIDYGLRANAVGIVPLLAPHPVGACPSHGPAARRSLRAEWAAFRSVKGGGHPGSMKKVLRRVRPRTWPFWFLWSYTTWWLRALRAAVPR